MQASAMTSLNNHKFEPNNEDTIQCLFFPLSVSDQESLEQLCEKINTRLAVFIEEYMWHRDVFKVFVPILDKNKDLPVHLISSTCFGDNIEDEWYIIHIILELTKHFTDIIVQVKDNDGDFLLIEAADHLPKWANPDSTENRVFIYKNHLHIIPPNLASTEQLKLSDALLYIAVNPDQTIATTEIQKAILNRIGNYPDKHKENTHNAIILLPLEIAAVLKSQPNLIAPIVDMYCNHDAIDVKACRSLDYQNSVAVRVKFTKCLYAMLLHSKSIKHLMSSSENNKSINLGKKITCGFKMIMNQSVDIYSSKEYHKFLKNLTDNGYFRGNIEGSHEYKKLLKEAKSFFTLVKCPISSNVASKIKEITASGDYFKSIELIKSSSVSCLQEDDEDWLKIHPNQLNELLNSRYGKKTTFENNDIITPQNISTQLTDFLKKTSDYEGIESVEKENSNDEIEFDSEQFVNCIDKMLKLLSTGEEENEMDSDLSEEDVSGSEEDELDIELKAKLQGRDENLRDKKTILQNMITSMKEEQSSSGPSSNLMSTLGCRKTDFLDSDDD